MSFSRIVGLTGCQVFDLILQSDNENVSELEDLDSDDEEDACAEIGVQCNVENENEHEAAYGGVENESGKGGVSDAKTEIYSEPIYIYSFIEKIDPRQNAGLVQ